MHQKSTSVEVHSPIKNSSLNFTMNFGQQSKEDVPREQEKRGSAMPPSCPRCELTKTQFSRTIQNYQKAFRKKVEGMKVELKSVRNTNDALRRQVKRLKSPGRTLIPGMVIGLVVGAAGNALFRRLRHKKAKEGESSSSQEQEAAAPAPQ
ncbi:hypothetical protein DUNSADRAFT_16629 [Dunaliella salina]|uniref:Encoded protein n=1 Tax=Dunaliella salina TaxID=3046 RepID=A0ABQ7G377_DUNSA|nr:hypothetical protein DUNSADRAFT_16629 [Dunaliella salina]|eukprot:KAF5829058.1 hypothetical protein DUNSADRAFT_16629 [Dunaliella salina]